MINNKAILLLATERSGTNLLRAILSSHSQIGSPPPFSMMDVMAEARYKYLSGEHRDRFNTFIEDAIKLTQLHLNPWDISLSSEVVLERANDRSFWQVFKALNELYVEAENKSHWFSKEPGLFNYIYELAMAMPEARFIYMTRDPRDVAASMIKQGLHEANVYHAALKWRKEQRLCLNASFDPMLRDRIFTFSYEDLIDDSDLVVKALMRFLKIDFEPAQLEFYKNTKVLAHSKKSEFWQNLNKPIDKANSGKHKSKLNRQQIEVIESICWEEMKTLGYQPDSAQPARLNGRTQIYYALQSRIRTFWNARKRTSEAEKHRRRVTAANEIRSKRFE